MRFFNLQTDGKTKGLFFGALISSLVVVGLYCYLWAKIIQKNQRIAVLLGEVVTLTAKKENLTSIKEKISETSSVRNKLKNFFISDDGVVPFLNMIQNLGTSNKLEFKVASVAIKDEKKVSDVFENVELNLEIKGSWTDVYRFATLVELMPIKTVVNQVDFRMISGEQKVSLASPKWSGRLNVSVLKLK